MVLEVFEVISRLSRLSCHDSRIELSRCSCSSHGWGPRGSSASLGYRGCNGQFHLSCGPCRSVGFLVILVVLFVQNL